MFMSHEVSEGLNKMYNPDILEPLLKYRFHISINSIKLSRYLWMAYYMPGPFTFRLGSSEWHACMLSCFHRAWLWVTTWTVTCQVPLSMAFSRHEYWSGLPFPPPECLPNPGIEPMSPAPPALQADSLPLSHQGSPNQFIDSIQALPKSWQACCKNWQADSKICMKDKTILKKYIVRNWYYQYQILLYHSNQDNVVLINI